MKTVLQDSGFAGKRFCRRRLCEARAPFIVSVSAVVSGASVASDAAVTGSHVCLQCVCAMVVIMAVVVYVVAGGAPVVF